MCAFCTLLSSPSFFHSFVWFILFILLAELFSIFEKMCLRIKAFLVINFSSFRLPELCVCVCERERGRGKGNCCLFENILAKLFIYLFSRCFGLLSEKGIFLMDLSLFFSTTTTTMKKKRNNIHIAFSQHICEFLYMSECVLLFLVVAVSVVDILSVCSYICSSLDILNAFIF